MPEESETVIASVDEPVAPRRQIHLVLPPTPPPPRDAFEKWERLIKVLSLVVLPLLALSVGKYFESSAREREDRRDFMKIALEVLRQPPKETASDIQTRVWAAQMLQRYSPIPIPPVELPKVIHGVSDVTDYNYDYTYDDRNRVTRFTYDSMGNRITATTPAGAEIKYSYDAAGRLTSVIDPSGIQTTYSYEKLPNPETPKK